MIPLPQGVRVCDRPHRYEEGVCEPVVAGAGGAAARSAERSSVLLPWTSGRSVEGDLARRPRRVPVHEAAGARPFFVAERGGRRGNDLSGAARLSAVGDRLAPSAGKLASDVGGMMDLACRR